MLFFKWLLTNSLFFSHGLFSLLVGSGDKMSRQSSSTIGYIILAGAPSPMDAGVRIYELLTSIYKSSEMDI